MMMLLSSPGCTSYVLASLASPWDELLSYLRGIHAFRSREFHVQVRVAHASAIESRA